MKYPAILPLFVILMTATTLASCGTLPASGPYTQDMKGQSIGTDQKPKEENKEFKYALVGITKRLNDSYKELLNKNADLWPQMGDSVVSGVSVGDTLSVTIYEAQEGGLFIPAQAGARSGNFVNIPSQTVDQSGTINVPFAGEIKVAGRSTTEIGNEISKKLGARAIEPQAIVSVVDRRGAEVSVIGAVNSSTKFTVGFNGEKILDAIARAGGPSSPGYETYVTLQRDGSKWTLPFDEIVDNPSKNIFLQPQDTIYLEREAKSYQVYGAAGVAGAYDFSKSSITLSEALGAARGLNDDKANPEAVYLYREQSKADLAKLGINLDLKSYDVSVKTIPVIYSLNLRDANGFFLAKEFKIQDRDIIYIANSASVEFTKFLNLLNPTSVTKINTQNAIEQ